MFSNIGETSQQCNIARQRCKTNVFLRNWLFDSFCQARLGLIVLKIDHRGLCPLSSIKVLGKISGPPKVLNKKDKSTLLSSEPKKWPQNLTITFPMWLIFIIVYIFLQTTLITPESSPSTLLLSVEGADSGVKSRCIRWTTFWGLESHWVQQNWNKMAINVQHFVLALVVGN